MTSSDHPETLSIGLFSAILICDRVSGAHFNNAVSVAIYFMEGKWKANLKLFILTNIAEIIGALIGATIGSIILPHQNLPVPRRLEGITYFEFFLWEMIGTFILTAVILNVKYDNNMQQMPITIKALSVAGTLYFLVHHGALISSAVYNPCVGLSLELTAFLRKRILK